MGMSAVLHSSLADLTCNSKQRRVECHAKRAASNFLVFQLAPLFHQLDSFRLALVAVSKAQHISPASFLMGAGPRSVAGSAILPPYLLVEFKSARSGKKQGHQGG